MTAFGLFLAGLGLGDLVAGSSGRPHGSRRMLAIAGGSALTLVGGLATGLGIGAATLALVTGAALAAWLIARSPAAWSPRLAAAVLWGFAAVVLLVLLAAPLWPDGDGLLGDWQRGQGFSVVAQSSVGRLVMLAGSLLVLCATGNALVRLLLAAAGTETVRAEQRLRGGRVIGPMERLLIFGFLVAGQPIAATIVAGAKSLLRFPEMRADQPRIDELTEYFLVGSLASWLFAVAPALLLG